MKNTKRFNKGKKHTSKLRKSSKKRNNDGGSGIARKNGALSEAANLRYYLENSSIRFLGAGANGVTFVADFISDPSLSPYVSQDLATFNLPVTKVLLKLLFLFVLVQIDIFHLDLFYLLLLENSLVNFAFN